MSRPSTHHLLKPIQKLLYSTNENVLAEAARKLGAHALNPVLSSMYTAHCKSVFEPSLELQQPSYSMFNYIFLFDCFIPIIRFFHACPLDSSNIIAWDSPPTHTFCFIHILSVSYRKPERAFAFTGCIHTSLEACRSWN